MAVPDAARRDPGGGSTCTGCEPSRRCNTTVSRWFNVDR